MSGDPLTFLKLSEVDITSSLQNGDYVVVIKENTNDGTLECKRITVSNLGGEFSGGGGDSFNRFTNYLPNLPSGQNRGTITLGASTILFSIGVSTEDCRVRLYGSQTDADNDLARAAGTPAADDSGLMAEFVSTSQNQIKRFTPAIIVYNDENPLNNFLYYTIDCTVATDVSFKYVRLENVGSF